MQHASFQMHKYVWTWITIFAAFSISFPIAMMRVSQTDKFSGQALNSWNCKGQVPPQKMVITLSSCTQQTSTSPYINP